MFLSFVDLRKYERDLLFQCFKSVFGHFWVWFGHVLKNDITTDGINKSWVVFLNLFWESSIFLDEIITAIELETNTKSAWEEIERREREEQESVLFLRGYAMRMRS